MNTTVVRKNVNPTTAGVFKRIAGALDKGEGFRHLWLGDSGMGKTTANRMLLKYIGKRVLLTLTIDDKSIHRPEYDHAAYRANPQDLRERPLTRSEEKLRHISFRGICYSKEALQRMVKVKPNDVAIMAWDLVRMADKPIMVAINLDELGKAQIPNSQNWDGAELPLAYREGRAVGISMIASTQTPQILNRESFALSDTMGVFRMTSREGNYLVQQRVLTKEMVPIVERLEVGQWLLIQKSVPWDSTIYKF
jgi:hypothetical protein